MKTIIFFLISIYCFSDITLVEESFSKPEYKDIKKYYWQNYKVRNYFEGEKDEIYDYQKGLKYKVNHRNKSVLISPNSLEKYTLGSIIKLLITTHQVTAQSTNTGQKKSIAGFECEVYEETSHLGKWKRCLIHYSKLGILKEDFERLRHLVYKEDVVFQLYPLKKSDLVNIEIVKYNLDGKYESTTRLISIDTNKIPDNIFNYSEEYERTYTDVTGNPIKTLTGEISNKEEEEILPLNERVPAFVAFLKNHQVFEFLESFIR